MTNDNWQIEPSVTPITPLVPTQTQTPVVNNIIVPEQKAQDVNEQITNEISSKMREQTYEVLQENETQAKLKKAVGTVVDKKVDTVVKVATGENNEVSSDLEKESLAIFGYEPGKSTQVWQTKWASVYHGVLSAIWMFIAMFTFAPVVFIASKLSVVIKSAWIGIALGILIYVGIILAIALPPILVNLGG